MKNDHAPSERGGQTLFSLNSTASSELAFFNGTCDDFLQGSIPIILPLPEKELLLAPYVAAFLGMPLALYSCWR
jgi:hypothetical protein